jgi:hypothetical protein
MVFGPTGNGKTHLLASFIEHLDGTIFIPYSVYAYGQIIKIFDTFVHIRVNDDEPDNGSANGESDGGASLLSQVRAKDKRWVKIRRPGVIVAGELTLEHLELGSDPVSRIRPPASEGAGRHPGGGRLPDGRKYRRAVEPWIMSLSGVAITYPSDGREHQPAPSIWCSCSPPAWHRRSG